MDRDLVEAARRGDREAYADLIRSRGDRLFALAQRILRDVDRTEDAVQDALVIAWRDLPGLRDPDRFDAWLHRLVVRSCVHEAVRQRKHITNLRVLPADLPGPLVPVPVDLPPPVEIAQLGRALGGRRERHPHQLVQRRGGIDQLHRLHAIAPRAVEKGLALARRISPAAPASLAEAMDGRARRLRALASDVDLFLAPTTFARDRALEFGLDAARVRVRRLGAITGPARPRAAKARRRIGFVGTLAPHKGVDVLIRAFRGLGRADLTLDLLRSDTRLRDFFAARYL